VYMTSSARFIEAHGYGGGLVTFDGRFIEISKRGVAMLVGTAGSKRIPLRAITAVQIKPAGLLTNGFIQFTMAGGNERRDRYGVATFRAAGDENSVIFTRRQQPVFEALRRAIEDAMPDYA
jgi:hypothetical protein